MPPAAPVFHVGAVTGLPRYFLGLRVKYASWRRKAGSGKILLDSVEFGGFTLRQYYKRLLQDFLAEQIRRYRRENGLTQERMAEALRISPRSYIDLEHGRYGCSMMTAIFFLVNLDKEPLFQLWNDLRELVKRADQHDAA